LNRAGNDFASFDEFKGDTAWISTYVFNSGEWERGEGSVVSISGEDNLGVIGKVELFRGK
jgi:hypothetical protein